jgi:hypothetical protein
MFKHELGQKAKDKITGFEGILTARVQFLTGCNRYSIQPQKLHDGKRLEGEYFDEDQIVITGKGILAEEVSGKKRGACAKNPVK